MLRSLREAHGANIAGPYQLKPWSVGNPFPQHRPPILPVGNTAHVQKGSAWRLRILQSRMFVGVFVVYIYIYMVPPSKTYMFNIPCSICHNHKTKRNPILMYFLQNSTFPPLQPLSFHTSTFPHLQPLCFWNCEHLRAANVELWKCGKLGAANVEMWKYGNVGKLKSVNVEMWKVKGYVSLIIFTYLEF